jgi:hypothetical protein
MAEGDKMDEKSRVLHTAAVVSLGVFLLHTPPLPILPLSPVIRRVLRKGPIMGIDKFGQSFSND